MQRWRGLLVGSLLLAALPAAASPGPAALLLQAGAAQRVVSGTVIDGRTLEPLFGARVTADSGRRATATDNRGRFRLAGLPGTDVALRVTMLGYRPVTIVVPIGADTTTVSLTAAPLALDELVISGTAGRQERRAQPAVVNTIDAAAVLSNAPISSVAEVLQSRVPGLSISAGSGTAGVGQRIAIRGSASISLSNEPLVFIDGVRMDAGRRALGLATGGLTSSALNDVNPNDIESIEVVKGPAAATLYGADASGGVIQIITKKGRAGARRFSQRFAVEYGTVQPNFTPFTNFATCTAAQVAPSSSSALCRGEVVGTVVSDNPLEREGALSDGRLTSLQYSGQGGAENFGYFISVAHDDETGVLPRSGVTRTSGRTSFNWLATPALRADVSFGLSRVLNQLPQDEDSGYGYLTNGFLGSPATLTDRGTGGWYSGNASVDAIRSIETDIRTLRYTPSIQIGYSPRSWLSNRLTVGGDLPRSSGFQLFPRNNNGWYVGDQSRGRVQEVRDERRTYTIDYLGNIRTALRGDDALSSDFSFGAQYVDQQYDRLTATGTGLTTNAAHVVSAAAQIGASQGLTRQKSLGLIFQEQLSVRNRLFVQLAARVDRSSSFGDRSAAFFLPKVGASYVISEEPFWAGISPWVSTLRLRAAYGTTGRAPDPGASLETYASAPYVTSGGLVSSGVIPLNPGNADLKPERGKEFEMGFEAGVFRDRLSLEVTYFNKQTTDLLLRRPQPPSFGFTQNPFVNIGEVINRGVEFSLLARTIDRPSVSWENRFSGFSLHNEVVTLGDQPPFGNATFGYFTPGRQLGVIRGNRIRSVDVQRGVAIVSDTIEFVGNQIPTFEANYATTLTLFRSLRLYGQLDGKRGFHLWNANAEYRERFFRNAAGVNRIEADGGYSQEQRLRRLGPYVSESGRSVPASEVRDPYTDRGDFIRLREVSATLPIPARWVRGFGASSASVSVAGRNLALWSRYPGIDPEVLSNMTTGSSQFIRVDLASLPQTRRVSLKVDLQF